jgi:hypothetical protein
MLCNMVPLLPPVHLRFPSGICSDEAAAPQSSLQPRQQALGSQPRWPRMRLRSLALVSWVALLTLGACRPDVSAPTEPGGQEGWLNFNLFGRIPTSMDFSRLPHGILLATVAHALLPYLVVTVGLLSWVIRLARYRRPP